MSDWKIRRLDEYVANGAIILGRGNIISKDDINAHPGPYPIYSSSAHNNGKFGEYAKFMFNEELVTWSVDGGGSLFYRPKHKFSVTNVCGFMRVKDPNLDAQFIYYCLSNQHKYITFDYTSKAHPSVIKKLYSLPDINLKIQQKIANILAVIDETIEKTEEIIRKNQQIKTGLMQDLFTRGIASDGKLRPSREQAPDLYHETKVGWIPIGWEAVTLDSIKESLADGPFGSNLKTEHYVTSPGVRVVRLQNIVASHYNDGDKAFISEQHAQFLVRNKVVGNDILVAGLGEDRYPVGRACLYPQGLPSAVNKADCFRLRCNSRAINGFIMYYLNTSVARKQISKFEQGVTRPRINTGNLKKIYIVKPTIGEQTEIFERLSKIDQILGSEKKYLEKLLFKKQGIMHDLLTGKKSVKTDKLEGVDV